MILAEKLNGLDSFVRGKADVLQGSPYLLYIRLTERFYLISMQESGFLADLGHFFGDTIMLFLPGYLLLMARAVG